MKAIRYDSLLSSSACLFTVYRYSSSIPRDFTTSSATFQPNFISLTNQVNRDEHFRKFAARQSDQKDKPQGIPRLSRLEVRPISILHETPRVIVAGRNFCNGFASNQYLLIHRDNNTCIFIDASDDWPDDWIAFMKSSRLRPTHIFLTHCHIDNVLSLNTFLHLVESEMKAEGDESGHPPRGRLGSEEEDAACARHRKGPTSSESSTSSHGGIVMGVMWNPAEKPWVDAFPRACERYGRTDACSPPLSLLRRGSRLESAWSTSATPWDTSPTPHYEGAGSREGQRRRAWVERGELSAPHYLSSSLASLSDFSKPRIGRGPPRAPFTPSSSPRPYPDIFLSSATNRSTSFYSMGPHTPLHYIFTPGHSPGHTMLHVARERLLFTGDVLGYQHVGRVDIPWGVGARLGESILALESLPDETVLLPGHGRLTTLGRERRHNKALQVLYSGKQDQPHREMSIGFNTGYL